MGHRTPSHGWGMRPPAKDPWNPQKGMGHGLPRWRQGTTPARDGAGDSRAEVVHRAPGCGWGTGPHARNFFPLIINTDKGSVLKKPIPLRLPSTPPNPQNWGPATSPWALIPSGDDLGTFTAHSSLCPAQNPTSRSAGAGAGAGPQGRIWPCGRPMAAKDFRIPLDFTGILRIPESTPWISLGF